MIDIHAHILPGIDDGAMDLYETVNMLEMAEESGVHTIVATPHCNLPGRYDNYFGKEYIKVFERVVKAAKNKKINITICPGMEVFATYDLPNLLVDKKIMPVNQSRYVLIEFAMNENPDFADDLLTRVWNVGAKPIIAHAERYSFVQDNPQIVYDWREKGYLIQCNKSSFIGKFGSRAKKTAYSLMDHRLISAIASDTHGVKQRTPDMWTAYEVLKGEYSEKYLQILFEENPRRICNNQPTLRYKLIPIE